MPVVQIQPSGVEQLKSGLDKLGQGLAAAGEYEFRMDLEAKQAADTAKVMDAYEMASRARARVLDTVQKAEGEDAIGITEKAKQAYTDQLEKIGDGLMNPEQVEASRRQTIELFNGLENTAMAHEHAQVRKMEEQKFMGTVQAAISDGIKYYNSNVAPSDPKFKEANYTWDHALDMAKGTTIMYGWRHGWAQEDIDAAVLDATSAIHLGVVKDMIHQHKYDLAQSYVRDHLPEIDGKKLVNENIHAQIKAGKDEQGARDLINSYGGKSAIAIQADLLRRTQPDASDRITADMYNLASQRLEQQWSVQKKYQDVAEEQSYLAFEKKINITGVPNPDPNAPPGSRLYGWEAFSRNDPEFIRLGSRYQVAAEHKARLDRQEQKRLTNEELKIIGEQNKSTQAQFDAMPIERKADAKITRDWLPLVGDKRGLAALENMQNDARYVLEKKILPDRQRMEKMVFDAAMKSPRLRPDRDKQAYNDFKAAVDTEWINFHRKEKRVMTYDELNASIASNLQSGRGVAGDFMANTFPFSWLPEFLTPGPDYAFQAKKPGWSWFGSDFYRVTDQDQQLSPVPKEISELPPEPLPDYLKNPQLSSPNVPLNVKQIDARIVIDLRHYLETVNPEYLRTGVPDAAIVDMYQKAVNKGITPDQMLGDIIRRGRERERTP